MANDIKQRIVLDGEQEYNRALAEARRNLKTLRSELKAETAELGSNATAQQKNEAKVKSLQKQIKEQEKVVRTYQQALSEVREKYSDNEDAIAKWEQKLNDARTTLANMKNSLEDTGKGMQSVGDNAQLSVIATNSLADSLGKVAEAGSMISGALEEAFKGIVGRIKDTIAEVWESVIDLAARSNNIVDLAGFWNTDPTKIQQWAGAVSYASASLEDISNLVTKINAGDAKKIAELTGVSNENYQDQWEYAMQVMNAMSQMSTEARNNTAFEIFGGRQATKAFDLLNDWDKVLEHLGQFDAENGGFGLTEEQLNNMSDLYDKVNGLKRSWQSLKDMATVELFGDLALNITGNLQNIVDAFKEYFQADDDAGRATALQKIKDNIVEIFTNIKDAIEEGLKLLGELAEELKSSDDASVRALGEILDKVVQSLQWFADPAHWQEVVRAFEAIIGVWATGKIVSALGHIGQFASGIGTIMQWFRGKGTGDGTPAPTGTTTGGGGLGTWLTGLFPGLATKVTNVTSALGTFDPTGLMSLLPSVLSDQTTFGRWLRNGASLGDAANASWETIKASAVEGTHNFTKYFTEDLPNAFWTALGITPEEFNTFFTRRDQNADASERLATGADWRPGYQQGYESNYYNPNMPNIPADAWTNKNELTSEDLSSFRGLPAEMSKAIASGAAAGVSGISVLLDGQRVGELVAQYVSEAIARDIP